jgi:serine/threonine protein kinase
MNGCDQIGVPLTTVVARVRASAGRLPDTLTDAEAGSNGGSADAPAGSLDGGAAIERTLPLTAPAPALRAAIDPRFERLTPVGLGAMGTVYRAWDRETASFVALKVPVPQMAERFEREAAVLATLDHPNIVRYVGHGVGRHGARWLAMEWLDGEELTARLARGPLTPGEVVRIARPIASALAWAHSRRIMHRDLKPGNLFLPNGELDLVKLLDFGLARSTALSAELTATGVFMGTAEYMPPEQTIDAKRADARSDVFSLGSVLFHCLVGRPPPLELVGYGRKIPPVRAFRPGLPRDLAGLVDRMLAVDRTARPANGGAVLDALRKFACEWNDPTFRKAGGELRAELRFEAPCYGPSGTVIMRGAKKGT